MNKTIAAAVVPGALIGAIGAEAAPRLPEPVVCTVYEVCMAEPKKHAHPGDLPPHIEASSSTATAQVDVTFEAQGADAVASFDATVRPKPIIQQPWWHEAT